MAYLDQLIATEALPDLLNWATHGALKILKADRICLYLWDAVGEKLLPAHAEGLGESQLTTFHALGINPQNIEAASAALFDHKTTVRLSGRALSLALGGRSPFYLETRSFWAAPLWDGKGDFTQGALAAHQTRSSRTLSPFELELTQGVARCISYGLKLHIDWHLRPAEHGS